MSSEKLQIISAYSRSYHRKWKYCLVFHKDAQNIPPFHKLLVKGGNEKNIFFVENIDQVQENRKPLGFRAV